MLASLELYFRRMTIGSLWEEQNVVLQQLQVGWEEDALLTYLARLAWITCAQSTYFLSSPNVLDYINI